MWKDANDSMNTQDRPPEYELMLKMLHDLQEHVEGELSYVVAATTALRALAGAVASILAAMSDAKEFAVFEEYFTTTLRGHLEQIRALRRQRAH
jgi:hypothetical protein